MADKKSDKKPEAKPETGITTNQIILWFLIILFVFSTLASYIGGDIFNADLISSLQYFGISLLSVVQTLALFISLLFIMGFIYAKFRIGQIEREYALKKKVNDITTQKQKSIEQTENKKWIRVVEHVNSSNPSDWRLSILEADILLGEVLTKAGYKGESIGEQLKTVERSDFSTIDQAWEAHKVRNLIAHEGSEYPLNQNEAKRIIALFEEVFREFYYI